MFDPTRLVNQFLGGAAPGQPGAGASQGGQSQGSGLDMKSLALGAAAGGATGLFINSRTGRSMRRRGMRMARQAAPVAGLALVGGLAYHAFTRHKANQAGAAPQAQAQIATPPADSAFADGGVGQAELGLLVLRAMIAAAAADGRIDADEQAAIFDRMDQSVLSAEEKAFLLDQMRRPASIADLSADAKTPEAAMEVYAASLLAIEVDTDAERQHMTQLARALNIEPELALEIERTVAESTVDV